MFCQPVPHVFPKFEFRMKVRRSVLVFVVLLSGCSVFEVPRSAPTQQLTPWAAQTVRDANKADRERFDKTVKQGADQRD